MAFTQSDVALLEAAIQVAITSGTWMTRSVQFSDQLVTFTSLKEMQEFLEWLRRQVAIATSTTRTRYAATSKGICR